MLGNSAISEVAICEAVSSGDTTFGDGRLEFTVPGNRLDFTVKANLDFTVPNNRLEFGATKP